MDEIDIKNVAAIRLEKAKQCLVTARCNINAGDYKAAANRAYYAIFHSMRAVLAFRVFDSKKHSGIIAEFRKEYIKTGELDRSLSLIITDLFQVRTECDYDDFYIVSKEEVETQLKNAETFVHAIDGYMINKLL